MSTEIVTRLRNLKLHGMAANWPELVARCRHSALEPEALVEQLLDAEGAERQLRSIGYQMKAARFPAHRDLAGFEFGNSAVDEALVRKLHSTAFTDAAHNVVFIGGPGTGKTHLATALGVEAIQRHGKRVASHPIHRLRQCRHPFFLQHSTSSSGYAIAGHWHAMSRDQKVRMQQRPLEF